MSKGNAVRFEVGKRLTKDEKHEVLKRYDRVSGDPIYGYEYNPEYMYDSDITGRRIRFYIKLPDGRIAHPTELYPNLQKGV